MVRRVLIDLDFESQATGINIPTPVLGGDIANKNYVDAIFGLLAWKDSVRLASTGNVTLATPGANLDSVAMVLGDRILLKDQTSTDENGIYIFDTAATPLVRATDADIFDELEAAVVSIEEGTVNAGTTYTQTEVNGTINVNAVLWAVFNTGSLTKFSADIGNGVLLDIPVVHNFGTRDVLVQVYDNATFEEVTVAVVRTDVNTVTIGFDVAPAAAAFRTVVLG